MPSKLRHRIHLWWNGSRFNKNYDPWISTCQCCCVRCEAIEESRL